MVKQVELKLLPREAADEEVVRQRAIKKSQLPPKEVTSVQLIRRSIDARGSQPVFRLRAEVYVGEAFQPEPLFPISLKWWINLRR